MRFSSLTQFRNVLRRVSFDIDFQESVRIVKKKGKNHLTVRDCALDKDLKTGGTGAFGEIIASGRILHLDCRGLSDTQMGTRAWWRGHCH